MSKMTIEQIKKDIADGKCKKIYFSSRSCWWGHLESHVEEATKTGKATSDIQFQKMLNNPDIPEEKKNQFKALKKTADSSPSQIPLCPLGAPLMETMNPGMWIAHAEENPGRYGRHGLAALILAHHENSNGAFVSWDSYNNVIDIENQSTKL